MAAIHITNLDNNSTEAVEFNSFTPTTWHYFRRHRNTTSIQELTFTQLDYQYKEAYNKIWGTQCSDKYGFNKGESNEKKSRKLYLNTGKKKKEDEAKEKSTLKYLNSLYNKCSHIMWQSTTTCCRDVRRANVKVRLLAGSYMLQSNNGIFNQTRNTVCLLCNKEEESTSHLFY